MIRKSLKLKRLRKIKRSYRLTRLVVWMLLSYQDVHRKDDRNMDRDRRDGRNRDNGRNEWQEQGQWPSNVPIREGNAGHGWDGNRLRSVCKTGKGEDGIELDGK